MLKNVRGVSVDLKAKLVQEALASGRSINDVAITHLSSFFNVKPELQGNPSRTPGLGNQLLLKVERNGPLATNIWMAAKEWQLTESSTVVKILSAHYGLPWEPRRPGRKKKVAA